MIEVRQMTAADIELVYKVFSDHGIGKPYDYIARRWEQNVTGERTTLLAFYEAQLAGSLHLLVTSYYPYFSEKGIHNVYTQKEVMCRTAEE